MIKRCVDICFWVCSAFLASAIQYNSGTDYSDDEEDEANDSDDADSICSASTLSDDEHDSMASDLVDSQFEEVYSDGESCSLNPVAHYCSMLVKST